jgi:transposase InsO family protein
MRLRAAKQKVRRRPLDPPAGWAASRFTDITEHPVRDGKFYCSAILDCFRKMIVARTFSTIAATALVTNAADMAVRERNLRRPQFVSIHGVDVS